MPLNRHQATAAGWLIVALGHTVSRSPTWSPYCGFNKTKPDLGRRLAKPASIPPIATSRIRLWDNWMVPGILVPRDEWCVHQIQDNAWMNYWQSTPGLINYAWSQNPALLEQPINKAIAALMIGIMWVSSGWYLKNGVNATGAVVAAMGGVQAWSAFA